MKEFSNLLSPITIGPIQVRNRVLVSAHVPGFAEDNKPGEKCINYHRQYAAGGVGLQITGGTPIHESGMLGVSSDALWNLSDDIIPGYQKLGDAVHEEGGRILAQLAHSAGTVLINQPGRESWSASAIRSQTTGNISHAMTKSEIDEVVDAYAKGAARVNKGELDGVEILSAFGFLPQAFLSPLSNWRDDEYGGTLENRMRFLIEVLRAVRSELGSKKILGVRLPGDEYEEGGLDLTQMKEICSILSNSKLVDFINVIAHTNFTHTGRSKHWAPTPMPHGVFVHLAAAIRDVVDVPVFAVGRIIDPRHAEKIIAEGKADMVGMTRAHICDPQIVTKIKNNALTQIRPCVGANTCIANRYAGKTIRCMHSPVVSEPGWKKSITKNTKKIAVIGGGPAGLEVARLCAEKGHSVTVFEAGEFAGGQLSLWARSHSMVELGKIIDWRLNELERLEVQLELNHQVSASELSSFQVDVVVMATGSHDRVRKFDGGENITVISPHELLRSGYEGAKTALVCSDGRGQAGLVATETLKRMGAEVELISSDYAVAADLDPTNRNAWYERLGKNGIKLTAQTEIDHIEGSSVILKGVFSGAMDRRRNIDLIIDWDGCQVNDELLRSLPQTDRNFELHAIGDCIAPRNVEVAMAEALRVADTIN